MVLGHKVKARREIHKSKVFCYWCRQGLYGRGLLENYFCVHKDGSSPRATCDTTNFGIFFGFNKLGTLGWMLSLLIWPENSFIFRLFPLREHGMNWRARPLTCQEIQVFILSFCLFFSLRSEAC